MHADLERLLAQPIAHRGLHACGRPGPVENSIGAARAAAAAGYAIECDVQLSRDGEAIVFHDDELGRLTGMTGRVGDMDAATLSGLTLLGTDEKVPSLADLLREIDGRVPLVIEIKRSGTGDLRLTDRTLALVKAYGGAVCIESFDPAVVLHCRGCGTERPVGLVGPMEALSQNAGEADAASDFLSWSIDDLSAASARCRGRPLTTWTVRAPEQTALARRHGAQIVFEGFDPSPFVNHAPTETRGLKL